MPSLDGIRALAVLAVMGVHLNLPFARGGGIGVMVFFVLSGFLITALLLGERDRFGSINLGFFYARRGLRLFPALLMMVVATCTISLFELNWPIAHQTLHFAPAALFYVGNWFRAASPNFVGGTLAHTWTLSVEEQFYLLWPVLLIYMLKRGASLRTVALVALAGAALSDIGKLVLWTGGGTVSADANRMYGTDLSADALLIGCALAVAVLRYPGPTLRVARIAALPGAVYLVVVVTLIHPLVGSFAAARAFEVIAWPMVSVAAAAVIGYLVLAPRSLGARLLGLPPLRYIGRISYGLYLWHYPVLIWMVVWFGFSLNPPAWQVAIDVAVMFGVAIASFHLVEQRMLRLKRLVRQTDAERRVLPAQRPGEPLIQIRGMGKRYTQLEDQAMLLQSILPFTRPRREELWALRNIDLEVSAGETVGVLGHNGAGKTTLLRLLAGVTRPTEGHVRVVGRIAPLISLGVGFHQEMSGRENVLVNGMLLGLSAEQVAERFDSIVEFAELEEFIDTPVKFYSSGMFMRLGFAVVVHVDPSILLVDEILAVGDAGFQLKCFERLRGLQAQGAAIVVVSHSLPTIRQLCRRAVLISRGRLLYDGAVEETIARYESALDGQAEATAGPVEVLDFRLVEGGLDDRHVDYDERLGLLVRMRFNERVDDPQICFGVLTSGGLFGGVTATQAGKRWRTFDAGEEADVRIHFNARLGPGSYVLAVEVKERDGGRVLVRSGHLPLTVTGAPEKSGFADVGAQFEIVPA